jgi:hypothetical protein
MTVIVVVTQPPPLLSANPRRLLDTNSHWHCYFYLQHNATFGKHSAMRLKQKLALSGNLSLPRIQVKITVQLW